MNKRLIATFLILLSISFVYYGCTSTNPIETNSSQIIVSDFPQLFSAPFGGPSPGQLFFYISGSSEKVLNYTVTNNSSWLHLFNSNQTLGGFTPDSILFFITVSTPQLLAAGIYYDTITIATDSSDKNIIQREVVLKIGSEMTAIPESFEFVANVNGINPSTQELDVISTTSLPFQFSLTNSSTWLTVPNTTYNVNDTDKITLSVDIAGLTKGLHTDTIWLSSDSALNSPYAVPVTVSLKSWLPQVSPKANNLNDVYFRDVLNGWAVGDIIDNLTKSGYMIRTTDGVLNWEEVLFLSTTTSSDSILGGVTFVDNNGWAVGSNGIILYSNNSGTDWVFQSPPSNITVDFSDLFFINADSGWIVGDSGVILATSDGGLNCNIQHVDSAQVLTGISFVDDMHGWVSGLKDVILVTSDGGQTWTKQTVPNNPISGNKYDFKEITFTDSLNGWAIGKLGLVISTNDGGATWGYQQIPQAPGLLSVFFANSSLGWITGQNGVLLHTTNGGVSWTNQFIETTSSLQSIYFVGQSMGWAVGSGGIIFHTLSGGE